MVIALHIAMPGNTGVGARIIQFISGFRLRAPPHEPVGEMRGDPVRGKSIP
jgi:hypothetical protein